MCDKRGACFALSKVVCVCSRTVVLFMDVVCNIRINVNRERENHRARPKRMQYVLMIKIISRTYFTYDT